MENDPHSCGKGFLYIFTKHYEGILIVLPPFAFLPLLLSSDEKAIACMYVLLVMIVYWITEVIPLAVTSMIPVLAFPMLGILDTDVVCTLYFKDVLVMFVTSIMVATAIEYSNLHIRMALRVLQLVGCSPRKLHLGVCLVTMFMSIWIANSACTAMMCPIIYAVLEQLSAQGLVKQYHDDDLKLPKAERRPSKMASCFYLSISYAASIGGCGSLIGTPTNLAFKAIYDNRFEDATDQISFAGFMAFTIPPVIVSTLLMYLDMELVFMGLFRPNSEEGKESEIGPEGEAIGRKVIDEKYAELGPITAHEISVALLFVALIILYIFRKPGFTTGWAEMFDDPGIRNSAPTVFILILLFALPANYKFLRYSQDQARELTPALLKWSFVIARVPWGLIFLVGGGAVLAEGSNVSGMATKIGSALAAIEVLPPMLIIYIVTATAVIMTNFSANVAICNILVPVFVEMAVAMKMHPLLLVYPVGMGCSMAFMLPVGTPSNALVQGYANITTNTMIIGGALPSFTTITMLWLFTVTWGYVVYPNMKTFPDWATSNHTKSLWIWDDLFD